MRRFFVQQTAWFLYASLIALYGFSLWALMNYRQTETFGSLSDALNILQTSLYQAGLSALLSTFFGILLARAFYYLDFNGKHLLYKLLSFVWVLPSLVVIFAVIGVLGHSGWLAQLWQHFGFTWAFKLYGLQGIILAHCLLNIPLVMKYGVEGLRLIPSSQHRLASQLNLTGWQAFKIVEW